MDFKFANVSFLIISFSLLLLVVEATNSFCFHLCVSKSLPFKIDSENLVDFQIPYEPFYLEKEKPRENLQLQSKLKCHFNIPDEIVFEIFKYLELKDFISYVSVTKEHFEYASKLIQIHLENEKSRFKVNVPKNLALAFYGAFLFNKLDFSRFGGLNGKVLSIQDFIAMNYFSAMMVTNHGNLITFSDFMPEYQSKISFHDVIHNLKGITQSRFPGSFWAFYYLAQKVLAPCFSSSEYYTSDFLPYTYQCLIQSPIVSNCNNFAMSLATHRDNVDVNVIHKILENLSAKNRKEFIRPFLQRLSALNVPLDEFDLYFKSFTFATEGLRDAVIPPESINSFNFLLAVTDQWSINSSNFKDFLANSADEDKFYLIFGGFSAYFLKYFYYITPGNVLGMRHLALKYLLTTENLDYAHFFELFDHGDTFSYCFDFFLKRDYKSKGDILLAFIDYAMEKEDFTVPKVGPYSIISTIYQLGSDNIDYLDHIIKSLKSRGKYLSYNRRIVAGDKEVLAPISSTELDLTVPYTSSHFDLLIRLHLAEEIASVLSVDQLNSTIKLSLSIFVNDGVFGLLHIPYISQSEKLLNFLNIDREWTFLELSIAVGNFGLTEFILNHSEFDPKVLDHEVDGMIGTDLIFNIVYPNLEFDYHWEFVVSSIKEKIGEIKSDSTE